MAGHHHPVQTRLQPEGIGARIEIGQALQRNRQLQPLGLARLQRKPPESHQGAHRPLHLPPRRLQVHLHHLRGRHRPAVGDRERNPQDPRSGEKLGLELAMGKGAVGEAEAEGEGGGMALAMQPPVAVPEVVDHRLRPRLKRRQVLGAGGHRKGHPARGGHPPQQHIGQGFPTLLAGVPEQQDRVRSVPPALTEDRATAHQYHHGAGVGGGHRQDQGLLGRVQRQLGAIAGGEVTARAG